MTRYLSATIILTLAGLTGLAVHESRGDKKVEQRVFEMRTYYTHPGRMPNLHARFRDHTCKLFEKHGISIIGIWSPQDTKEASQKMVYILAYPSKDAATKSWDAFRKDPAWITAKDASEKDGAIVSKVESVFMNPTDYSPIK